MEASAVDAAVEEDVGFLFRFLGGLQFREVEDPIEAPASARLLAVSSTYGVTFFCDREGATRSRAHG
jgi:hypothetical protein